MEALRESVLAHLRFWRQVSCDMGSTGNEVEPDTEKRLHECILPQLIAHGTHLSDADILKLLAEVGQQKVTIEMGGHSFEDWVIPRPALKYLLDIGLKKPYRSIKAPETAAPHDLQKIAEGTPQSTHLKDSSIQTSPRVGPVQSNVAPTVVAKLEQFPDEQHQLVDSSWMSESIPDENAHDGNNMHTPCVPDHLEAHGANAYPGSAQQNPEEGTARAAKRPRIRRSTGLQTIRTLLWNMLPQDSQQAVLQGALPCTKGVRVLLDQHANKLQLPVQEIPEEDDWGIGLQLAECKAELLEVPKTCSICTRERSVFHKNFNYCRRCMFIYTAVYNMRKDLLEGVGSAQLQADQPVHAAP